MYFILENKEHNILKSNAWIPVWTSAPLMSVSDLSSGNVNMNKEYYQDSFKHSHIVVQQSNVCDACDLIGREHS